MSCPGDLWFSSSAVAPSSWVWMKEPCLSAQTLQSTDSSSDKGGEHEWDLATGGAEGKLHSWKFSGPVSGLKASFSLLQSHTLSLSSSGAHVDPGESRDVSSLCLASIFPTLAECLQPPATPPDPHQAEKLVTRKSRGRRKL